MSLVRLVALTCFSLLAWSTTASALTTDSLRGCENTAHGTVTAGDGSVLVVATSLNCSGDRPGSAVTVKLNPDGTVAESWSDGGVHVMNGSLRGVALTEGKLVYASPTAVERLNPDGSPDQTFAGDGIAEIGSMFNGREIGGMTVDSQGRTVLIAAGSPDAMLARLDAGGEPDDSFGVEGIASPAVPSTNFVNASLIETDSSDRTVFAGYDFGYVAAMRLTGDGSPDTTFGPADDGYAKGPPPPETMDQIRSLDIGEDGIIRIAQVGLGPAYCEALWFHAAIDAAGHPLPSQSVNMGCGDTDQVRLGPTSYGVSNSSQGRGVPTSFGLGRRRVSDTAGQWWRYDISPGSAGAYQLEYLAASDQLLGSGFAIGGDCFLPDCAPQQHIALVKADSRTGVPDPSFGTNGEVIIPGNTCAYGAGPAFDPPTAWQPCRVKPPVVWAKAWLLGTSRPTVVANVRLPEPPRQPGLLRQRMILRIPAALRLKRKLRRSDIGARSVSTVEGTTTVRPKGRALVVAFTPRFERGDPVWSENLTNSPVTFRVKVKRGVLAPVRKGRKIGSVRIPLTARYDGVSGWWAPNGTTYRMPLRRK